jgi:inhibitor of KinA
LPGITDIVPSLRSICLHYDPAALADRKDVTAYDALIERLQQLLSGGEQPAPLEGRLFEIPVAYGAEHGPDLATLAQACSLTPEKVIELHCATTYSVHMLGFAPGFGYLGCVDPRLRRPRKETPSTAVPAGSVALANEYTCVYPLELPAGWHVIGCTPWKLFDPGRMPPALLSAGDSVRFLPIPAKSFATHAKEQAWR